jgi:uncharacterized membrane protein
MLVSTRLKALAIGVLVTVVLVLLFLLTVDIGLPKSTWILTLLGYIGSAVFGFVYIYFYEEGEEWWKV